jgi:hypothetical protein
MSDWRILLGLKRLVRDGHSIGTAYGLMVASTGLPRTKVVDVYCRAQSRRVTAWLNGKRRKNSRDAG